MFNFFKRVAETSAPTFATVTTPDELIATKLIDKMAREFDKWKMEEEGKDIPEYECPDRKDLGSSYSRSISWRRDARGRKTLSFNRDVTLVIDYTYVTGTINRELLNNIDCVCDFKVSATINKMPIEEEQALRMLRAYVELKKAADKAATVARRTAQFMKENETKWNFVEKQFGIKRDSAGRLIMNQYEEQSIQEEVPITASVED